MDKKAQKEAKRLEKLRAEEEMRKQLKRDELKREVAAQARRRSELDKSWGQIMLAIKEPVFKQEMEEMWHTFERVYDKKEHLISYTIKLMDVADDQFQRTVASFCDTIDRMINNFLADMDALSKENDLRTKELLKRAENDAHCITLDHNTAETHLQLLLYHGHTTSDSQAWATRGEDLVKEDEERKKYSNDRQNLRSFLEETYGKMWDDYKAVLKSYVIGTAENQKRVRQLRKKEAVMSDIIASQAKRIANNDGLVRRLRTELSAYESGTKQAGFRNRRNRYRTAFMRMKKCMVDGYTNDTVLLGKLVNASNDSLTWLTQAYNKGDKIIRMAALCRKFETQGEKVLPFGTKPQHFPSVKAAIRRHASNDSLVNNALSSTSGLTRIWRRIAQVELTRRALLREKTLLENENALILETLQRYNDNSINIQIKKICRCSVCPSKIKKETSTDKPTVVEAVMELSKLALLNKSGGNHC